MFYRSEIQASFCVAPAISSLLTRIMLNRVSLRMRSVVAYRSAEDVVRHRFPRSALDGALSLSRKRNRVNRNCRIINATRRNPIKRGAETSSSFPSSFFFSLVFSSISTGLLDSRSSGDVGRDKSRYLIDMELTPTQLLPLR